MKQLIRKIPFGLSAGAYMLLAVPATGTGLAVGAVLTVGCFVLGLFLGDIRQFARANGSRGHWITAAVICLLMGLRFDNVWKLSSQLVALTARLHVDTVLFLTAVGCVLAVCAVYFTVTVLIWLMKYPLKQLRDGTTTAEAEQTSRFLRIGILVLLAVQLGVLCFWGVLKQSFHVDEVYTFELSNYPDTIYGDTKDAYATWKTGDTFTAVLEPANGRLFDLSVPFWNGETDNHPSTYYILVNIFSSVWKLFGISVNKWVGLIPNFACCMVTTFFLVQLLRRLLGNDLSALLGGMMWVFSVGTINMGIYLRMYALLVMSAVIFTWLHLRLLSGYADGKAVGKTLALVQLATIAGILSQYYFLFFAFFFCSLICVYFLVKKDWSMLGCYMTTEIAAVAAAELLFPRMFVRLLFGDRGTEALENMLHGFGYVSQLRIVLEIISRELFGGYGTVVLAVSTLLLLTAVVKKKRGSLMDGFALLLLVVACGYILAVTKIAPYQVDRYFMCIFPLLILYSVYGICRGFLVLFRENRAGVAAAAAVLVVFTVFCIITGEVSYVYLDGADRAEVMEAYEDLPVVALNGDNYNDSVLQWAFEFRNFEHVFLCRNNEPADIVIAAEDGMFDEGFLLYVHQDTTDEEELFAQISKLIELESWSEITDTQECRVFYCTAGQK